MDIIEAINGRKSIRAFKNDPVDKTLITKILEAAIKAPSAINQQPWHLVVVTGEAKERLASAILREYKEKGMVHELVKEELPKKYERRTQELFTQIKTYLDEMGQDMSYILEGSCRFYDAPVAIMVTMDKALYPSRLLEIGAAMENLMLAAHSMGLGTCPIGFILRYEEAIREELGIPNHMEVVLGIALGYPDLDSPINRFRSSREGLDQSSTWIGFE
ncbi:MAG TPA: nitroreductase [Syntrophaceae bacterium]|nr:nitroreductase [Syntrophaceae bacterium]